LANTLTGLLLAGTLPGVIVGAVLRVDLLAGGQAFTLIVAAVLLPLGLWLMLASQRIAPSRREPSRRARRLICLLSLAVGTVGGIYGIGGGSLLAPILLAVGFSAYEVAPATLAATFVTSIAGIATYQVLQLSHGGAIAPDWALGAFLGAGGFAGSYCGARLQSRLPERSLRRLLGCVACLVAARYIQTAVSDDAAAKAPAHTRRPDALEPGQAAGRAEVRRSGLLAESLVSRERRGFDRLDLVTLVLHKAGHDLLQGPVSDAAPEAAGR
jgi:uncharacterized protein